MHGPRIAMTTLLLMPTALGAEDLEFGVRSGISWTDNVFGVSEDEVRNGEEEDPVSDVSLRLSPYVAIDDPDGELEWNLRYQPSYERYLDETELSGFDQTLVGDAKWRFAERWTLTLRESFAIYQNAVRFNEAAAPGEEATLGFRNEEVRSNRTSVSLGHALTPRDSLSVILNYNTFEYPDGEGSDRSIPSAALWYQHVLSERTTAGLRFSWIQQTRDRSGGSEDETFFYNLAGTLDHRFSPTFRVEASAGPTLVDTNPPDAFRPFQFGVRRFFNVPVAIDADTCEFGMVPGLASLFFEGCALTSDRRLTEEEFAILAVPADVETVDDQLNPVDLDDVDETDLTYFARLSLVKSWETVNGILTYQRSNSENSRFGSSSVVDSLSGSLSWKPRPLWTLGIGAGVSLQEQAIDQATPVALIVANVPAPAGVTSVAELAEVQAVLASTQDDAEEYRSYSVSFNVNRQLTRRSTVFASVFWFQQEQDGALSGRDTQWDNLVLWIGLDWHFDPIRL